MFYKIKADEVRGISVNRYVASWYAVGGKPSRPMIEKWLRSITVDEKPLTDDEIEKIAYAATTGKFELEQSAKNFV